MPEYLAPGVYVEETSFRSKSIEGVSTSTAAFVGPTRKGPLSKDPGDDTEKEILTPEVITSFGEFERVYGGLGNLSFTGNPETSTNYLAHAVKAFFDNGGARLYIARAFSEGVDGRAKTKAILGGGDAAKQVAFVARFPGSVFNGPVKASLLKVKTGKEALTKAPIGSMIQLGGESTPEAAQLTGGNPPFALSKDDELELLVDKTPGAAAKVITFTGESASVEGNEIALTNSKVDLAADLAISIKIDGGVKQSITIPLGSYDPADLALMVNNGMVGGKANVTVAGDEAKLSVSSDTVGSSSEVIVYKCDQLGFDSAQKEKTGTGNVADLNSVSLDELNNALKNDIPEVKVNNPATAGVLELSTVATGDDAFIKVVSAPEALGLAADAEAEGKAGKPIVYRVFDGENWVDKDGDKKTLQVLGDQLNEAYLLTISLSITDSVMNETVFDDLGLSVKHPRWIGTVLPETPSRKAEQMLNPVYLDIGDDAKADSNLPFNLRDTLFDGSTNNPTNLAEGTDGTSPVAKDYETGLKLLETIEDISIVAAPGYSSYEEKTVRESIQGALISHAERLKYRIAVLDTPAENTLGGAKDVRSKIDSKYAALYYPWVVIGNPLAGPSDDSIPKEIALPPSGFVCGVYARTDISRGVFKAPANEIVRGALRFEREINKAQQDTLNPMGVNCLRFFYGRGNRIWGARTASSDPEWKYVNVRRYFIYLERSIDRSTQWVVFEPNGERLWANIRETVSNFLYTEWKNGALMGAKPEEAFFVRCDRSTMTQNDLDNGRLICEIGVAVLYPAEFVIFRIGQKTADARA